MSAMFVTLEYETFYFLLALASATGAGLQDVPRFHSKDFWRLGGVMATFFVAVKAVAIVYPF